MQKFCNKFYICEAYSGVDSSVYVHSVRVNEGQVVRERPKHSAVMRRRMSNIALH